MLADWAKLTIAVAGGSSVALMILLTMLENSSKDPDKVFNDIKVMEITTTEFPTSTLSASDASVCRKTILILAKRLMKHLTGCIKELKQQYPDREEFTRNYQCSIRCFMIRTNLVNEERKMTNETITAFIDVHIPPRYHGPMLRMGKPCMLRYVPLIDDSDPTCTAHGDLIKCMQNTIADSCMTPPAKKTTVAASTNMPRVSA